jgi:hypothetical protein
VLLLTCVSRKPRRASTSIEKNVSLRFYAKRICEKVQQRGTTSYSEVAEELVQEVETEGETTSVRFSFFAGFRRSLTSKKKKTEEERATSRLRCAERALCNGDHSKGEENCFLGWLAVE